MKYTKVRKVKSPKRGHDTDAGIDFFIPNDFSDKEMEPGESLLIPSGIKVIIPEGHAGIFFNKSSIGTKGVIIGAQVIDSDYRGEVHIDLHNVGDEAVNILAGSKITQLIILPIAGLTPEEINNEVFEADVTKRGVGGFGSTGDK